MAKKTEIDQAEFDLGMEIVKEQLRPHIKDERVLEDYCQGYVTAHLEEMPDFFSRTKKMGLC